jgi:hypothetical protein
MIIILKTFYFLVLLSMSTQLFAAELNISPIIGFERYFRVTPEPARFNTRVIYGASATYGVPLLAAELEVTQGSNTDTVVNSDNTTKTIKDTRTQARFGARSLVGLNQYMGIGFRAGARAREDKSDVNDNGVLSSTNSGIQVEPYFGAWFTLAFSSHLAVSAGATLTRMSNGKGGHDYEMLYSLSGNIRFGQF